MHTNTSTTRTRFTHTPAGRGPHHLVIGTVTVSTLLGGDRTAGKMSLVELNGLPGSGPGPHLDPWQESFYVLEGELTFRFAEDGAVRTLVARPGDAVSIPQGIGHAFSVTGPTPARYLIASTPAGIDAFFADAGESIDRATLPTVPSSFDRDRLRAAFAKHGLSAYSFPAARAETAR
jgi:quercetin dioxygenase-like cupin family protein